MVKLESRNGGGFDLSRFLFREAKFGSWVRGCFDKFCVLETLMLVAMHEGFGHISCIVRSIASSMKRCPNVASSQRASEHSLSKSESPDCFS
jgi:hypothetical protein